MCSSLKDVLKETSLFLADIFFCDIFISFWYCRRHRKSTIIFSMPWFVKKRNTFTSWIVLYIFTFIDVCWRVMKYIIITSICRRTHKIVAFSLNESSPYKNGLLTTRFLAQALRDKFVVSTGREGRISFSIFSDVKSIFESFLDFGCWVSSWTSFRFLNDNKQASGKGKNKSCINQLTQK